MANVSLMPHNGGSQRRRQRQRRWRWQQQLPAASKICNIHQSHSTHRWPGMRMSSRAALERSNSFRIRIHSIRIRTAIRAGCGSGCACGALFLGLGLICLAHFQVNYTYLWHLRYSNMKINAVGRLSRRCWPYVSVLLYQLFGELVCVCVSALHATTKRHVSAHCEVGQQRASESRCQSAKSVKPYFMSSNRKKSANVDSGI